MSVNRLNTFIKETDKSFIYLFLEVDDLNILTQSISNTPLARGVLYDLYRGKTHVGYRIVCPPNWTRYAHNYVAIQGHMLQETNYLPELILYNSEKGSLFVSDCRQILHEKLK